jgi:ElaA protein
MAHDATTPADVHRATFAELTTDDLYGVLRLRSSVFVLEQDCAFLDLDDRDREPGAEHLWIADEAGVTATLRLLPEGGGTWHLGRVVTRADVRSRGVAAQLVRAGLDRLRALGATTVEIGAQAQLRDWYARFGFSQSGPRYLEDGILHLPMALDLTEAGP